MNSFERELEDIVARCARRPVLPVGYIMRIEQRGYGTYLTAYRRPLNALRVFSERDVIHRWCVA